MRGIKDKVVVITGASSESIRPLAAASRLWAGTRARVMALIRRSPRPTGMLDAFDRVLLR